MALIHEETKTAFDKNIKEMLKAGHSKKKAQAIAKDVKHHVHYDEIDERRIERAAHEKLKYGR